MSCNVRTMSNDASEHPQSGPRCRTDASVLRSEWSAASAHARDGDNPPCY